MYVCRPRDTVRYGFTVTWLLNQPIGTSKAREPEVQSCPKCNWTENTPRIKSPRILCISTSFGNKLPAAVAFPLFYVA